MYAELRGHFVRGILCGFAQRILRENVDCVETQCAARGSNVCESPVKKSEDFDRDKKIW
ncbi:MAG: hypothetical protein KAU03_02485 [Candidatus Altiarchaeales archaeon]|nr:hypothetical protein [Candidatus Altiarchaeales archaeon]